MLVVVSGFSTQWFSPWETGTVMSRAERLLAHLQVAALEDDCRSKPTQPTQLPSAHLVMQYSRLSVCGHVSSTQLR